MPDLAEAEATMLAIESKWWRYPGIKEQVVREKLDMSMTAYFQALNTLIDTELALQIDPATTRRLHSIRAARQLSRSARRSA